MYKPFIALCGLVFLVCAGLQWNDPDLYVWIPLYGLAAWSCALAWLQRPATRFNQGLVAVYAGYAVYLFFAEDGVWSWMAEHQFDSLTQSMMATAPWIENTREFGGLFIMCAVCVMNLWVQRKRSSAAEPTADVQPG